jgi:hypothetical protein
MNTNLHNSDFIGVLDRWRQKDRAKAWFLHGA